MRSRFLPLLGTLALSAGCADDTAPSLDLPPILAGVPNVDDDDGDGVVDWEAPDLSVENDLVELVIPASDMAQLDEGETIEVLPTGGSNHVRIRIDGEVWHGDGERGELVVLHPGDPDLVLSFEFDWFLASTDITVTWRGAEGGVLGEVTTRAMAAPLVLNNHLQPSEHTWALHIPGWNNEFVGAYEDTLGGDFTALEGAAYDYDPWVQDEIEFGTLLASDGHRVDFVIDSIRDGLWQPGYGLDDFPENELEGPDFARYTWGEALTQTSQDSFGNLEISPPVTVDGVAYPFGRIYYGEAVYMGRASAPAPELIEFLESQKVQAPFKLDTSFLCVGHVDEWMTFVPDPDAPKGFRLVYTIPSLGYELLESLDPSTSIPRFLDHGYATIGDILADDALRALNEEYEQDYIWPNLDTLKAELGLDDEDIVLVPGLFEEVSFCGGAGVALIPGTANLIVEGDPDGGTTLYAPDPFLRTDLEDQGADPFIAEYESLLPASLDWVWMDDWVVYHMGLGEVHCGSNVTRTPLAKWWIDAAHLLEGDE